MIIGTAGHIDHGKTALVHLLTGIDTDRLPEEKQRGLTIELGFAHTELEGIGQVGIVDVPGHERFIRNMVAGASGIDVVLLVIAADDGVMPQTREHLDIISLLGITNGVIALNKIDLVAPARINAVSEEIRALLEDTVLASAPVVPVSSKSGEGLVALRQALADSLMALRTQSTAWPFWMPIDRVFVVSGFGIVATGTIESGRVVKDANLRILPGGKSVRVRGIQIHDSPVDAAEAGSRCALNLTGIEKDTLQRGMVVCEPGLSKVAHTVDASVTTTRNFEQRIKNHARVRVHCGTAESLARLQWLESTLPGPAETGLAQLRLYQPMPMLYGRQFILRNESAQQTIGGGVVLDAFAERRGSREPVRVERLKRLSMLDPDESLTTLLESRGAQGWLLPQLAEQLAEAPDRLEKRIAIRADVWREEVEGTVWIGLRSEMDALEPKLKTAISEYLHDHPKATAVTPATLHSTVCDHLDLRIFRSLLNRLVTGGDFELCADGVRPVGHLQSFSQEEVALSNRVENLLAYRDKPPPKLELLAKIVGLPAARLRHFMGELERSGRVVKLADSVYVTQENLTAWREQVQAYLHAHQQITVAQFRDQVGINRNLAILVLEHFDQKGVTKRTGNSRVIGIRSSEQRTSA